MDLRYTFDPERFYLGTLCKHDHRWPGTNLSLRRNYKSPEGITVNCCLGCNGRKDSDWLISFIDTRAMGLPEGIKPGKPCKGGHLWNGFNMSLRNRNGKCEQCEKERKATPKAKAANKRRHKAWYQANIEELRHKARERMSARLQDPEQRRVHNERNKQCVMRRRRTIGRVSRTGLLVPPNLLGHSLRACDLQAFADAGWDLSAIDPATVLESRKLWFHLKNTQPAPTVAELVHKQALDLVAAEKADFLENGGTEEEWIKEYKRRQHHIKMATDPDYVIYMRQKSKRRKAQMRGSVAIQVTARQIRARFAQFDHRCAYCGSGGDLHIEHVVPISKGGPHSMGNIIPACKDCNFSKRDHDAETWYRAQPFFSELRWRKICRVLGWNRSSVGQLALL
jgi:5-methylcytosine-specific restriction endonuclease McrA